MAQQIYRKEALDRLASPEQLDQLMSVTDPRGWIALAAAAMILVMALLWSLLGSYALTVDGEGVLVRPGGVKPVEAPTPGRVAEVRVGAGQDIGKGTIVAHISTANAPSLPVVSPYAGRILAVHVKEGDAVDKGAPLVLVEFPHQPLQAVVFVPAESGYHLQPGMEVHVSSSVGKGAATMSGRVVGAARLPANRAAMQRVLENDDWAATMSRKGPLLEVVVKLNDDASPAGLFSGAPCRAQIVVGRQRPIHLIVPALSDSP